MRAGKNADTRTTESITLSSKSEGQGALRRVLEGRKHTRGAGGGEACSICKSRFGLETRLFGVE